MGAGHLSYHALLLESPDILPGVAILQKNFFSVLTKLWSRCSYCCWSLAELNWISHHLDTSVVRVVISNKEVICPGLGVSDDIGKALHRTPIQGHLIKANFPLI